MGKIRILSTKRLLPNQKQFLLNAGFSVLEADFIKTRPVSFDPSQISGSLIFTSKNAVDSFMQNSQWKDFTSSRVYCVGEKTAENLRAAGFRVEKSTHYAYDLLNYILENRRQEQFTFLCGNLRMDTLPAGLATSGISLREIEVYQTELTPAPINPEVDAILFFSPSGVESFLRHNELKEQWCFCIGTTTAAALKPRTNRILMAGKPTIDSVIISCINYFSPRKPGISRNAPFQNES